MHTKTNPNTSVLVKNSKKRTKNLMLHLNHQLKRKVKSQTERLVVTV